MLKATNHILPEMMFGFGEEFAYFECSKCGCLQISEIPVDISKYYPSDYYSFSQIQPVIISPLTVMRSRIIDFIGVRRDRYALFGVGIIGKLLYKKFPNDTLSLLSKVGLTKDSKILDVGCGSGILLHVLKQAGCKNLLGVDKYIADDIHYKNGLTIRKGTVYDVKGCWDIVMFNHSFEHFPDQLETLQVTSELLSNRKWVPIN